MRPIATIVAILLYLLVSQVAAIAWLALVGGWLLWRYARSQGGNCSCCGGDYVVEYGPVLKHKGEHYRLRCTICSSRTWLGVGMST